MAIDVNNTQAVFFI
ncbi:hypothetical protein YPPY48_0859, partial [Yersinia pestis PY-48]